MAIERSVLNDETKSSLFRDAYKNALSDSIKPTVNARTKGWTVDRRETFRKSVDDFLKDYIAETRQKGKEMLDLSKTPGKTMKVLEFERTGDAREIARQFLPAFKAAVAKADPNIEIKLEMDDNWITITATNTQTPQPKVAEKAVAAGPKIFGFTDEETKGGELSDNKPVGGAGGKGPAAQ